MSHSDDEDLDEALGCAIAGAISIVTGVAALLVILWAFEVFP